MRQHRSPRPSTHVKCTPRQRVMRSDRPGLHDDSLRLAAIRISACDRESLCNLVDYILEPNASLLDKRCPWRAADLTGGNAARIRLRDRNSFRFNPCRTE